MPLTRVWLEQPERRDAHVGQRFVARTGLRLLAGWKIFGLGGDLGAFYFDDRMRVTALERDKRHCEIEKLGGFVGGVASFTVNALPDGRCELIWRESLTVWPQWLSSPLRLPLAALGRLAFTTAFRRLAKTL